MPFPLNVDRNGFEPGCGVAGCRTCEWVSLRSKEAVATAGGSLPAPEVADVSEPPSRPT